ncbi:SIMPL domain-containing protein [Parendozoicomonas sp. Alg238-R29]|uniref:SIMPL domain-containing protein n=1 Tax=Parendozoicomonas sp. Alg238-R29 TaxID=2993446 RepID=UPI00248DA8A5|nr:SIMPL domain-containing protein [Parendozoicomonas sp. Alg238-R29]
MTERTVPSLILGICFVAGLAIGGYQLAEGIVRFQTLNRSVVVKGLSEQEVPADIAIWPIRFKQADNQLGNLINGIDEKNQQIITFLQSKGFARDDVSISPPSITDNEANSYVDTSKIRFRYTADSVVTVYTSEVNKVRTAMQDVGELGRQGIAFSTDDYNARTEFLFNGLNDLKPKMIEEATQKAREVAEKFARDSDSKLGKIKSARQGVFQINDRDRNTPYIKRVRVISTVEYYLVD